MEKKKIGINASYLRKPNTGIGQVTLNFLRELKKTKNKSTEFILYLEEDLPTNFVLPKNFTKKIFLPIWKRDDLIRKIWWEKYALPRQVRKDGCDAFISTYQCPTILDESIKNIMVVHDIIPKLFPEYLNNWRKNLYWKLTEMGIGKVDKIIAVSKRTEKDLIQHLNIDAKKITISYIDVDEAYKKPVQTQNFASLQKKCKINPGYILAGGGYEKRKNIEGVIRAYKIILDRNKKEHFLSDFPLLIIYGKVLPKNLSLATDVKKLLKELNLTTHVKLLGEVAQKDLPAIFQNASLFVYPSLYEGFGMPVLEAMSTGTPVVTSKISSLPEVGGDSVLYCDPNDTRDIAMVLKNVLTNHDLRETLKARGKERAKQFSWEKFAEKILNIIRTTD